MDNTRSINCGITNGVSRSKKAYLGGIKKVYLFPFVKLKRSQIYTSGVYLNNFPITSIYSFDVVNKSFTENSNADAAGLYYDQNLSFDVPVTSASYEIHLLAKRDYRAIILDNVGNYRILGLYNGLEINVTNESGTDKASLNGYKVTLKGKEENQAYFLSDLSLFRQDEEQNYIFEDGCNYIFEDGNNYIFN